MISLDTPIYAVGMKSALWLKALALCSTVALGGGYVWWSQQKSANHRKEVESRSILPGSKSKVFVGEPQASDEDYPTFDEAKGTIAPTPPRTNADFISPAAEEGERRTILPGSKSALVLPPEGDEKKPKGRTVLPGSKTSGLGIINRNSIDDILNSKETEKEDEKSKEEPEKKRTVLPGSKSIDRILQPSDLEKKSEP